MSINVSISATQLYIPIWFYSNLTYNLTAYTRHTPLHSNMVLFKLICLNSATKGIRTLHSNMVLFKSTYTKSNHIQYMTLHSNMVLFKLEEPGTHICCIYFTFQYGSIQIMVVSSDLWKNRAKEKGSIEPWKLQIFNLLMSDATLDSTTKTAVRRLPTVKMKRTVSSLSVAHSSVAVFVEPSRA